MSPKDLAVRDIKEDLRKQNKSFLAFHNELNSVMRKLVVSQIKHQVEVTNPFNMPIRHKTQLMARCFFANGQVRLENYSKYYKKHSAGRI